MNDVLYFICRNSLSIMDSWIPTPSTVIAEELGMSVYQVRKELKRLKELGLIASTIYCGTDEYSTYAVRGYTITDKAKGTEEYKTAYGNEEKIRRECFEMVMTNEKMYK